MKIFLDTANIKEIKEASSWGVVDGVTTNPTLISKEGRPFDELVREITRLVSGPVSVEATSADCNGMALEARALSKVSPNVVIKIPLTKEGLKAIKSLGREGIKTNATLIFSANQALLAAKAGAAYVSPFIGRLDDIGHVGMDVVRDIVEIFEKQEFSSEVIVASVRHPLHVTDAARCGAHAVTVPFGVLENMVKHPLTDIGIKRFLEDWAKVRK